MDYIVQNISKEDDGRSFVGITNTKSNAGRVVVVPYGYQCLPVVNTQDKPRIEQLRRYVKAVQKALNDNRREGIDAKGIDNPYAAINIIHDYLSMGRYIEYESYCAVSNRGKINFKKTLKTVLPKLVHAANGKEAFYYETFVTNKKRTVENNLVATVQANIINDFMFNGGDLLFGQALRVTTDSVHLKDPLLLIQLRRERNTSFNSRKLNLINWEMEYICSLLNPNYETRGEWNYAIIAYAFWETVVDTTYGTWRGAKTLYGTAYPFYDILTGNHGEGNKTQHDTIYEDDNYIIIIDSKMYASQDKLLTEDVLGKQFGYYLSAKNNNPKGKTIINILFVPWISGQKGFQYRIIEEPYTPLTVDPDRIIFTYACPVNELIDDYIYGRRRIGQLKTEFLAFIKEPAVRAYLNRRGTSY